MLAASTCSTKRSSRRQQRRRADARGRRPRGPRCAAGPWRWPPPARVPRRRRPTTDSTPSLGEEDVVPVAADLQRLHPGPVGGGDREPRRPSGGVDGEQRLLQLAGDRRALLVQLGAVQRQPGLLADGAEHLEVERLGARPRARAAATAPRAGAVCPCSGTTTRPSALDGGARRPLSRRGPAAPAPHPRLSRSTSRPSGSGEPERCRRRRRAAPTRGEQRCRHGVDADGAGQRRGRHLLQRAHLALRALGGAAGSQQLALVPGAVAGPGDARRARARPAARRRRRSSAPAGGPSAAAQLERDLVEAALDRAAAATGGSPSRCARRRKQVGHPQPRRRAQPRARPSQVSSVSLASQHLAVGGQGEQATGTRSCQRLCVLEGSRRAR